MNLVLADTEEFRKIKGKAGGKSAPAAPGSAAAQQQAMVETEVKRTLGLTIVRGANIVSCSVEGPPPSDPSARLGQSAPGGGVPTTLQAGTGISRPAGRGLPVGLGGPVAGIGGPAPPPSGFGGFPPAGFPGGAPPGFGRGGPPPPGGAPPPGFQPPAGFGGPPGGPPAGFQPPPGFQGPPGQGRGFPPPGFGGR